MTEVQVKPPFSNLQMEILKLFSQEVTEQDLLEIKAMISKYFFEKSANEAQLVWQQRGYDEAFLQKILKGEI